MSNLDPNFITHSLVFNENIKPIQYKPRKMHPRVAFAVKKEIEKYLATGFIILIDYSPLICNIIPATKLMVR